MTTSAANPIWILVKVESGIPVCVEAFDDEASARQHERELRESMNPENDEIGVFELSLAQ